MAGGCICSNLDSDPAHRPRVGYRRAAEGPVGGPQFPGPFGDLQVPGLSALLAHRTGPSLGGGEGMSLVGEVAQCTQGLVEEGTMLMTL